MKIKILFVGMTDSMASLLRELFKDEQVIIYYLPIKDYSLLTSYPTPDLILSNFSFEEDMEIASLNEIVKTYPFVPYHNLLPCWPDISWQDLCKYNRNHICIDPERCCPLESKGQCKKFISFTGLKRFISAILSVDHYKDYKYILAHTKIDFWSTKLLKEWAREFHTTSPSLSKGIKEIYRQGYREFCIHYKMDRAAELLKTTFLTIKEIASELGYDYAADFSRAFKKNFGVSPVEYRSMKRSRRRAKAKA